MSASTFKVSQRVFEKKEFDERFFGRVVPVDILTIQCQVWFGIRGIGNHQ